MITPATLVNADVNQRAGCVSDSVTYDLPETLVHYGYA
jgi:diphthamide synthase subunit DPH2